MKRAIAPALPVPVARKLHPTNEIGTPAGAPTSRTFRTREPAAREVDVTALGWWAAREAAMRALGVGPDGLEVVAA